MKFLRFVSFVLAVAFLDSCLSKNDTDKNDERAIRQYLADNGLTATRDDSRLYYIPLTQNTTGEKLVAGNVVDIYFKISVMGGNELDKQEDTDGPPLKIQYNSLTVSPKAIDLGLALMRIGETYRFFIPSSLGFGSFGTGSLPSNSILDLELSIIDSRTEEQQDALELETIDNSLIDNNRTGFIYYPDLGIYYKEEVQGTGPDLIDGHQVDINYVGKYFDGEQFDAGDNFSFSVANGQVITGLSEGIKLMKKGGRGIFIIPSAEAYGPSAIVIPRQFSDNILPYSILEFDITVL